MSSISGLYLRQANPEAFNLDYTDRLLAWHFALLEDHLLMLHAYLKFPPKQAKVYQQCLNCIFWHLEKIQAYNNLERVKFVPECSHEDCIKAAAWAARVQKWLSSPSAQEALKFAKEAREFRYFFAGDEAELPEVVQGLCSISELYLPQGARRKEEPPGPGLTGVVPWELSKFKLETKLVRSRGWDPSLELKIRSPQDVVEVSRKLEGSDRERLLVLYLNASNDVIGIQQMVIGTRETALVPADALIRAAILANAGGIIIVHNHPSGNPEPSFDDIHLAKTLKEAGKLFDITLLDHVIIGEGGRYVSLRERGEI